MGPHVFVMLPRLFTAERGSLWWDSHCIPPTEEELEVAGPNLLQGGPTRITFAKPSELHWMVVADKSFSAFCKKAHEMAATEKKGGTPSTAMETGEVFQSLVPAGQAGTQRLLNHAFQTPSRTTLLQLN